jgi:hypothetical protein
LEQLMSDTPDFGFGKFVPGFDFLQNLAKGASKTVPHMPQLGNWVAPTLSVEDLDKRISELKTVQFWLDQNAVALKATIQALEVQKMTLATLKGMNLSMGDLAKAFTLKPSEASAPAPASPSPWATSPPVAKAAPAPEPAPSATPEGAAAGASPLGVVDPMQWWGALTQQFQQIAANTLKEAASTSAMETTQNMAAGLAQGAIKTATDVAASMTRAAVESVNATAASAATAKAASRRTKKTTADATDADGSSGAAQSATPSADPAASKAKPATKSATKTTTRASSAPKH